MQMDYKLVVLDLVWLLQCVVGQQPVSCRAFKQDYEYGRICSMLLPESLEVVDHHVLVGTPGALQVFYVSPDLENIGSIDLTGSPGTVAVCENVTGSSSQSACKNFIRVIQVLPEMNRVLVCGSNYLRPYCTVHQQDRMDRYTKFTSIGLLDQGYAPFKSGDHVAWLLTSNGRFFSYARHTLDSSVYTLGMTTGLLQRDTSFAVQSDPESRVWFNRNARVVSMHEYGLHVYIFLTEVAFELDTGDFYSRVARVCRSDNGFDRRWPLNQNYFKTFQKARIKCLVGPEPLYFYEDVTATALVNTTNGTLLYAVFNSNPNGPPGAAICQFSFDPTEEGSIGHVFDSVEDLVLDEEIDTWVVRRGSAYGCPEQALEPQRQTEEALKHIVKVNPIQPVLNHPPVIIQDFVDNIAVELLTFGEDVQEIIYFTTQQGNVEQVVHVQSRSDDVMDKQEHRHIVYRALSTSQIRRLVLNISGVVRHLYLTTYDHHLIQLPRGQCRVYYSCHRCLDSRDAYCGWDLMKSMCVNKLGRNPMVTLMESVLATEEDVIRICGPRRTRMMGDVYFGMMAALRGNQVRIRSMPLWLLLHATIGGMKIL